MNKPCHCLQCYRRYLRKREESVRAGLRTSVVADYMGCYCSDLICEVSCSTEISGDQAERWEGTAFLILCGLGVQNHQR